MFELKTYDSFAKRKDWIGSMSPGRRYMRNLKLATAFYQRIIVSKRIIFHHKQ